MSRRPSDLAAFLARVEQSDLFSGDANVTVARAPGRLDVMGGIADYSGSLVLELPLADACRCAVQRRSDRGLVLRSEGEAHGRSTRCELSLEDLEDGREPISYEQAQALFRARGRDAWAGYAAGAFLVLMRERGVRFEQGASLLVDSSVPEGKGVSSSAALEVAVMEAVAAAWAVSIEPRDLALLCQTVENRVVGAPCGVMDQMTAACGLEGRLLALRCQPCELLGQVEVPAELAFFGIDSGVRHSVGGDAYGTVRAAAFMGYRILTEPGDHGWCGYLANCTPDEIERLGAALPAEVKGDEFLARYGTTPDPVTRVEQDRRYPVRAATFHPVLENARVKRFRELLEHQPTERARRELGELMFASHASYSACGLGAPETDWLVERVHREAVARTGLWGAKITGGGSGGTVAVLGDRDRAAPLVARIADEYGQRSGAPPRVFAGSSPGAREVGVVEVAMPPGRAHPRRKDRGPLFV